MAAEESLKHDWIKVTEKNNHQVQYTAEIHSVCRTICSEPAERYKKEEWVRLRSESCISSLMF